MGVIRAIIAAGCLGGLLAGCESVVPLAVDTPLVAAASFTGTDCFFETSGSPRRADMSSLEFVLHQAASDDDPAAPCAHRQGTADVPLFPGLRLRPGYALEITALDAGQVLERSRNSRQAQSTIPYLTTLPVRRVNPVAVEGRLTALEEGVLLAALTTRRRLCFTGSAADCRRAAWAQQVRSFFDAHAVDLWNALVDSARLIPIDRALYTQTATTPGHAGVRWGLFLSFQRVCESFIAAKTDLADAERDKLARTFTGFYGRKTTCDGARDRYYMVPRYLVGGPNALVLAAIAAGEFTDLTTAEGFLGKPVMARYVALAIRPQAITPERPGPAKDWTLDEWEWSGICDLRARVRRPDEQQRLAIRAFVPRQGYPVIRLLPPSATDGAATFDLVEAADDGRDDAFSRHRSLRLRDGRPALDGHSPLLARGALKRLYLDDIAALVWHRTTADGNWAGASDIPPAGCNFGQIRGSW